MTEIYQSSTGSEFIADMNYHDLAAAHAKLMREDKTRVAEIEAMGARLAVLNAEQAEKDEAQKIALATGKDIIVSPDGKWNIAEPLPADHLPGANNPPEPTAYEVHATHINDLYIEAKNWADGADIASEA